jgi:protein required for attachment to host cells
LDGAGFWSVKMHKPRIQFLVVDGGRARWVRRSVDAADDFETVEVLQAPPQLRDETDGVVFEGTCGQSFSVGQRNEARTRHHALFASQIADLINAQVQNDGFERLSIVAPVRMLNAIKSRLSPPARAKLGKTLAKDLTKAPDHELGNWLRKLEFG